MRPTRPLLTALLLLATAPSAQAPTPQRLPEQPAPERPTPEGPVQVAVLTATDFRFTPSRVVVRPGQRVRLILLNRSGQPDAHNLRLELPEGDQVLAVDLRPTEQGALEFTAPERAGEYPFYCPVGRHRDLGMRGTLVVQQGRPPQ